MLEQQKAFFLLRHGRLFKKKLLLVYEQRHINQNIYESLNINISAYNVAGHIRQIISHVVAFEIHINFVINVEKGLGDFNPMPNEQSSLFVYFWNKILSLKDVRFINM